MKGNYIQTNKVHLIPYSYNEKEELHFLFCKKENTNFINVK